MFETLKDNGLRFYIRNIFLDGFGNTESDVLLSLKCVQQSVHLGHIISMWLCTVYLILLNMLVSL